MAFIGFEEEYDQYKKESDEKKANVDTGDVNTIAYDNMEPISDEDLDLLKHTINRHDALKVYMNPDTSFYDSFYNHDEEETDPLLQEARGIRRLYKNIPDYKYALHIRDLYIKRLIEKYGGEEMYQLFLHGGKVQEWVPPYPILSKHAEGYDLFIQGIEDMDINDYDTDSLCRLLELYQEDIDVESMDTIGDVETRREALIAAENVGQESNQSIRIGGSNANINGVSVNDLTALQQMFTSWYTDDKEASKNHSDIDVSRFFSMTPEAIRKQYFASKPIHSNGVLEKLLNGEDYDFSEHENLSEMVIDDKTRLPMTRGEMKKRQFIRKMDEYGWDSVKLMRRMSVGSEYELRVLDQKKKRNKIAKKKAKSMMDTMMGTDIPQEINTIDELERLMFKD